MEFPSFDELLDIDYTNPRWYKLKDLPNEKWKDIQGYEGLYQISDYGRVKSLKRNIIMHPGKDSNGYLFVQLYSHGIYKHHSIHVLVCCAFTPNPENKPTVNHEDGVKSNNRVSNLTWMTYPEQLEHSFRIGLRKHQCSIQRKACIVHPDNNIECFDALSHLSERLGYKKGFCQNRIRKFGNIFYEKELMIVVLDKNNVIPKYKKPSVYDINLLEYCKLNNLNYGTVRGRKRRGWTLENCVKPTKKEYIEYSRKEGDINGVSDI